MKRLLIRLAWLATALGTIRLAGTRSGDALAAGQGQCDVEMTVVEAKTGKPVPYRITIENTGDVPEQADSQLIRRDRIVRICDGVARFSLPPGRHTYGVERGPEYRPLKGTMNTSAEDTQRKLTVKLERLADPAAEGWWSGDLHVHRPLEDIERQMRAEDLHVASVITWWRTIVDHPKTFRFAQTAPYYVEIGTNKRRVSKVSAEFFRVWLSDRYRQLSRHGNPVERQELLEQLDSAKKFWEDRVARANAP